MTMKYIIQAHFRLPQDHGQAVALLESPLLPVCVCPYTNEISGEGWLLSGCNKMLEISHVMDDMNGDISCHAHKKTP